MRPSSGPGTPPDHLPQIGFGGGCHWCTEAVFSALRGVTLVQQGFIRSAPPDDSYSEAVLVTFRPGEIPLDILIEIHLRSHASTSDHKMRGKYRSAVYTLSQDQARDASGILADLAARAEQELATRVLPFAGFKPSDSRFHRYAETHAGNQFCIRYIDPKLARLRAEHAGFLNEEKEKRDERA